MFINAQIKYLSLNEPAEFLTGFVHFFILSPNAANKNTGNQNTKYKNQHTDNDPL